MFWWINNWPLSGEVNQSWLLQRAGDPDTEERVVREVASYGRQIGILSSVMLALVEHSDAGGWSDAQRGELEKLRKLSAEIEQVKAGCTDWVDNLDEQGARDVLARLHKRFPTLLKA